MRGLPFVLLTHVLAAADFSTLTPQGYVSDFAQVLDPAHRAEVERYASRVQQLTGAEMALVTIRTLEGEPIEDVANTLYRKWGVGKKGKDEGVLLLLVPQDRRMRLEVGYGLEPILPDAYSGQLLRSMRPLLKQGKYGESLLEAAHQIGSKIAAAKGVALDVTIPSRREVREEPQGSWLAMLVPAGMVLLALVFFRRSRSRSGSRRGGQGSSFMPMIFPMGGWGGGSGGGSGGGFGGYDSSDSFGGFGGGDSGGGGASSDW